jgi:hypothetical protein
MLGRRILTAPLVERADLVQHAAHSIDLRTSDSCAELSCAALRCPVWRSAARRSPVGALIAASKRTKLWPCGYPMAL